MNVIQSAMQILKLNMFCHGEDLSYLPDMSEELESVHTGQRLRMLRWPELELEILMQRIHLIIEII